MNVEITENRLVKKTVADYMEEKLGWGESKKSGDILLISPFHWVKNLLMAGGSDQHV